MKQTKSSDLLWVCKHKTELKSIIGEKKQTVGTCREEYRYEESYVLGKTVIDRIRPNIGKEMLYEHAVEL